MIDRSVRDCWQIGAERIALSGGAWPETLAGIFERGGMIGGFHTIRSSE